MSDPTDAEAGGTMRSAGVVEGRAGADPDAPAAELIEVTKTYGQVVALDSLSLRVEPTSITCLVGPNGAGKTTTVECIEGLRSPDRGSVTVLGLDPADDRGRVFERVGVQLQESSIQVRLRVQEILTLFASFYAHRADIDDLLERFALAGKRHEPFEHLSSGQKRRLQIMLALIGRPELIILDEPTSGLDPQARHNIWSLLKDFRSQGITILVTTHYLEEAEDHADHVWIIDHGKIAAHGRPDSLLAAHGLGVRIWVPHSDADRLARLQAHPDVTRIEPLDRGVAVFGPDDAVRDAVAGELGLDGTEVRRARLEDLFLLLTGRAYREE